MKEDELLKLLSPYLNTLDLSRIHAISRYRNADQATLNTLVSCYYRLGSEFLGPRRHYRQETRAVVPLPLPELPVDIFSDDLICNIFFEHEKAAATSIFDRSPEECYRYLAEKKLSENHPLKQSFIDRLITYFHKLQIFEVGGFKDYIIGGQKDLPKEEQVDLFPFPSSHQKEYAYRFIHKDIGMVDLLIGDTGTRKTGGAILAMAAAGAKGTLIVCPAGIRDHWEKEVREKHLEDINVIKIRELKELIDLSNSSEDLKTRYLIISYSLLSYLEKREDGIDLVKNVFDKLGIDSIIADEVHQAKEPESACTRVLCEVSRLLPERAPRIAMTATGVVNSPEDLDAPIVFLKPYEYRRLGDFSNALRNDPWLISALLHGKGLMTRWLKEDILGDKLPDIEYIDEAVPFSPFHQLLYEFVYNDSTIESNQKRGILRQVSLEPLLIRKNYNPAKINELIDKLLLKRASQLTDREKEETRERIEAFKERLNNVENLINSEEIPELLNQAYDKYLQWYMVNGDDEPLDEDFLVKLGYGNLVLWAFFNLPNGVDDLIGESSKELLKEDWVGLKGLYSTKYRRLREILGKIIPSGENKVAIFSGFYQTDISTSIEDAKDAEFAQATLLDHLASWFGSDRIIKIDGTVALTAKQGELTEREKSRIDWRLDPLKNLGLFTVRASRLGIDLTIPSTEANRRIKKSNSIRPA